MTKTKKILLTSLYVYLIYKSVKSIIEDEIADYRNANKFEDPAVDKFVNDYYQWSLKYKS